MNKLESNWIAEAKKADEQRKLIKDERTKKIIDCNNKLNKEIQNLISYIIENVDKLKGKKLYCSDGSKSQYFKSFLEKYLNTLEKDVLYFDYSIYSHSIYIKAKDCVNGGSYDNHSHYCDYITANTGYIIELNPDRSFKQINPDAFSYRLYSYEIVKEAQAEIKNIDAEIEKLKEKIRLYKNQIPQALQN